MARRDRYDEDFDLRPRRVVPADEDRRLPLLVLGGVLAGLIVAAGAVIAVVLAARSGTPQVARPVAVAPPPSRQVAAPRPRRVPPPPPPPVPRFAPPAGAAGVDNWPRLIGTWQIVEAQSRVPQEIIIRADRTASLTFVTSDGQTRAHETSVEITSQMRDAVTCRFHVAMGSYTYSLTFRDDDTLAMSRVRTDGPTYRRVH